MEIAQEIEKLSLGKYIFDNYRREGKILRNEEDNIQWESISNDDITKRKIHVEYIVYLH